MFNGGAYLLLPVDLSGPLNKLNQEISLAGPEPARLQASFTARIVRASGSALLSLMRFRSPCATDYARARNHPGPRKRKAVSAPNGQEPSLADV